MLIISFSLFVSFNKTTFLDKLIDKFSLKIQLGLSTWFKIKTSV